MRRIESFTCTWYKCQYPIFCDIFVFLFKIYSVGRSIIRTIMLVAKLPSPALTRNCRSLSADYRQAKSVDGPRNSGLSSRIACLRWVYRVHLSGNRARYNGSSLREHPVYSQIVLRCVIGSRFLYLLSLRGRQGE